jgi:hypothetical protein
MVFCFIHVWEISAKCMHPHPPISRSTLASLRFVHPCYLAFCPSDLCASSFFCLICRMWHSALWNWHHFASTELVWKFVLEISRLNSCPMLVLWSLLIKVLSIFLVQCDYLLLNDRIGYTDMILMEVEAPRHSGISKWVDVNFSTHRRFIFVYG